ncbi:hypothetical protein N657DRAFT_166095 [Parathielavia appendiculata]|uniref:Uncharacterized protein n=1 Tax=Parathielavia appendiculata TaxID=2587402 RepID=A0AAN6YZS9_9PEZI|nr:hypothetical protein N657DRAFT_166095 [Parathielavia appendiculata]
MIRTQLTHLGPINNMTPGDPWLWGSEDAEQLLDAAKYNLGTPRSYELSIQQDLLPEVDQLIQQLTNLITINKGHRSRDMNTNIWRLSWVTASSAHHNPIKSTFTAKLELFEYPEDHN